MDFRVLCEKQGNSAIVDMIDEDGDNVDYRIKMLYMLCARGTRFSVRYNGEFQVNGVTRALNYLDHRPEWIAGPVTRRV